MTAGTRAAGSGTIGAAAWPGFALALAGSISFSGKAIIVKLAYRYGVDAVTLIMYRMLFALPMFLLLAWWAGRGKPALIRRDWLAVIGLGFSGYYLASLLDFMGLAYISASLERLILYLNPTIVLGLSVLLGATLVFGSAVSYASYLVASGRVVKRLGSLRLTGLATTVACLFCIAHFLLLRPISAMAVAPEVLWLSLLNATACTFAPVLMVMMAIERLGPTLTAQTGMVGPLSTIALSVLLLGEPFTPVLLLGTVLVLAGIWLLARSG